MKGRGIPLVIALLLAGCGKAPQRPVLRVGSLPHPGTLNLFVVADPDDLGEHEYRNSLRLTTNEVERGIIYTRRAGFLDLSHVRDTIDMTRYLRTEIARALAFGARHLDLDGQDMTRYHLTIDYPPWWDQMNTDERTEVLNELPIRLAQHMAWDVMNWHEIITWYGYKTTGVFSEAKSAFTYEDTMSHAVGLRVADSALRRRSTPYDTAVTGALADELETLQVVSKEDALRAVDAVQETWWKDGSTRRMIPPHRGTLDPWIVPGWEPTGGAAPVRFELPTLLVRDRDYGRILRVEFETHIVEIGKIRADLEGRPERIDTSRFPDLLHVIRASFDPSELAP